MPEGPFGGPRPAASSNFRVNITLESFAVSEQDINEFIDDPIKENELIEFFEEKFRTPVKTIEYTSIDARAIDIYTRTNNWLVYDPDSGSDIQILVDWIENKLGMISSITMRCE